MKTSKEEILEYISDDLIIYLKSGRLCINTFFKKLNLNIDNLDQLLKIHFLLHQDVQKYVEKLPRMIRKFKTSTKTNNKLFFGEVKGQIDWNRTIKKRINLCDSTVFSCNEKDRWYGIKENLVLKEFIEVLYNIMFNEIEMDKFTKYKWFENSKQMKENIKNIYEKNIYMNRIKKEDKVTNRMIEDTIKSRNALYREAAKLLKLFRNIMNYYLHKNEVYRLLKETFIDVSDESTLFELYWIMRLIKDNAVEEKMYVVDGTNNMVASWEDGLYRYDIYHDSTGSNQLSFYIALEEVEDIDNDYLKRKIRAIKYTKEMGKRLFKDINEKYNYFWNGRPDIIIEVRDRKTGELVKIVLGEVKHTLNKDYALHGLKELMEYIMFVKEMTSKTFVFREGEKEIAIEGILFLDRISFNPVYSDFIRVISFNDKEKVKVHIND